MTPTEQAREQLVEFLTHGDTDGTNTVSKCVDAIIAAVRAEQDAQTRQAFTYDFNAVQPSHVWDEAQQTFRPLPRMADPRCGGCGRVHQTGGAALNCCPPLVAKRSQEPQG